MPHGEAENRRDHLAWGSSHQHTSATREDRRAVSEIKTTYAISGSMDCEPRGASELWTKLGVPVGNGCGVR
jgi:hypothetical protein